MTRVAALGALGVLTALVASPATADSPITSTHFCEAYLDYPIVVDAQKSGVVTKDIARYLTDDNPIDVKAAVINALSWDTDGKDNAARYCKLRYRDTGEPPDVKDMDGHEAFVLGYLTVMDDYFHPDAALPYMDRARELLPESYTVAMVRALVMAQAQMDKDDWGPLWESVSAVMENEELNGDMRVGAVKIITDYMILYASDAKEGDV